MTPYDDDFAAFLAPRLTGRTVADRITIVRDLLADARSDGTVPVGDRLVSVSDRAWTAAAPADAPLPTASSRPWWHWLLGGILILLLLAILFGGGGATPAAGGSTASTPVRADNDGATAPISLVAGPATFPIRAFDPGRGWPDPAATPDAALWGRTTINVVLGLDATVPATAALLDTLTGNQALTLRRADGTQTRYRVRDRLVVDRSAVEYAAQATVGLTLVGFAADGERVIIRAVPADAPLSAGTLGGLAVDAQPLQWVAAQDGVRPTLALTLTLAAGATGPLTVTSASGAVLAVVPDVAVQPAIRLTADPAPGASTLDLQVAHAGTTLPLQLPIPAPPTLTVTWSTATRVADTLALALTLDPSGPVLLPTGGTCTLPDGQQVPLTLEGLALPALIDARKEVIARCPVPATLRGLVQVTIHDSAADVQLP